MKTWPTTYVIQEFLISRGTLRPRSLKSYEIDLTRFLKAFPKDLPMEPRKIQEYFNNQHREKGKTPLTPETIHHRYRSVRAMYRQFWIWHQKELERVANPINLVRVQKPKTKPQRFWSYPEIYKFFNLKLTPRDRALLTVFSDIGPRATECAQLTWDDITPGFVTLNGKTGTHEAPISDTTLFSLDELKRSMGRRPGKYVFQSRKGGGLTYWGIYHLVRKLCKLAGITGKRLGPHTFRHTFGTYYAAAEGCDLKVLQTIMGHLDFKTTMGYIQSNRLLMSKNHARCTPLNDIANAAQSNFLDKVDAVRAAETIIQESAAAFVSRKPPRSAGG
jgi:integrase/recombinase XerD